MSLLSDNTADLTGDKLAVSLLVINPAGRILAVSRRDNPDDLGLPGGKVEPGENPRSAARREFKEETGLALSTMHELFQKISGEYYDTTYNAKISGGIAEWSLALAKPEPDTTVRWTTWDQLQNANCTFAQYNKMVQREHERQTGLVERGMYVNPLTQEIIFVGGTYRGRLIIESTMSSGPRIVHPLSVNTDLMIPMDPDMWNGADSVPPGPELADITRFAVTAHNDVNQYYDRWCSYSVHLAMAAGYAARMRTLLEPSSQEPCMRAIWSHDTMEDCNKTFNNVCDGIGVESAELVFAVTNHRGRTRKERAPKVYYEEIAQSTEATFVKLCDRIANMEYSIMSGSTMSQKYAVEQSMLIDIMRHRTPRLEPMWNYLDDLVDIVRGTYDDKKSRRYSEFKETDPF